MRKGFLLLVLTTFIFFCVMSYAAAQLQKPVKALSSTPSASPTPKAAAPAAPIPPAPTLPPPANLSLLNITTPNGGEKWVIGSTQNITWTTNLNGYCMVELYRGSTSPQTRVGMIGSGTQISNKIMSWKVGSYDGGTGTAPPGNDYWIVIKSEAVAKSDASNGPFTLMAITASPSAPTPLLSTDKKEISATSTGLKLSTPPAVVKILSLTYPRRADAFHKGIRYKITWQALNLLKDATMVIELLDPQETTILQSFGDIPNTGETFWEVPMTLPDKKTLYKIRIRTKDTAPETGARSDAVAIFISKGATPAGPPTLKVTNPGMGDRAIGDTIPIKWTSTTTCSGNIGPLDDGFRIDLIGKTTNGVNVSMLLKNPGDDVFDNEGPTGVLNWHWDWKAEPGSCNPGTYQIRVKNWDGKCTGTSESFRIIGGETVLKSKANLTKICYHQLAWDPPAPGTGTPYTPNNLVQQLDRAFGVDARSQVTDLFRAPVGFYFFINVNNTFERNEFVLRSHVTFSENPYWYKASPSLRLTSARLEMRRQYRHPDANVTPCLVGIAALKEQPFCQGPAAFPIPIPPPSYPYVSVASGEVVKVDLTQHYLGLIQQGKPDYGIMLISNKEKAEEHSTCNQPICIRHNLENYDVSLHVIFEKK